MCANRLNDWKTMPTSLRSFASARPSAGSGWPSKVMVPELIGSSRLMARHSVDLPEPDGPITTTTSPRATDRLTSSSTCSGPNHLFTFSRTMRASSVTAGPSVSLSGHSNGHTLWACSYRMVTRMVTER